MGGIVGVGFVSGKEAQLYWGSGWAIAVFALPFALATLAMRELCRKSHAFTVREMGEALFGKRGAGVWQAAVAFCSFVCIVTVLAGANECLTQLFAPLSLPVYAFVAAVAAALLALGSVRLLKWANALSLVLVGVLISLLYAHPTRGTGAANVTPCAPIVYALFSVTVTLGVARSGKDCTAKENVALSFVAALVAGGLMFALLPLCDFGLSVPTLGNVSPSVKIFAALALLLCAATGLATNAIPVAELVGEVLPDKTLCVLLIFGTALALSVFGLDFTMRVGYAAVAVVGALTVFSALVKA